MDEWRSFKLPMLFGFAIATFVVSSAIVLSRQPAFLPSHLIQFIAVAAGATYAWRFRLLDAYPERAARGLLLLAFLVPLENTFFLKVYRKALLDHHLALEVFRPSILLLVGIAIIMARRGALQAAYRTTPRLLLAAFWVGAFGVAISTTASARPGLSAAAAWFEFVVPFLAFWVFLSEPDRRFYRHAIALFVMACLLALVAQALSLVPALCCQHVAGFPVLADEFLEIKRHVTLMMRAGANGFGNPDNFVSLQVLLLPLLVAGFYGTRFRWLSGAAMLFLIYANLLTYSRGGLAVLLVGLGMMAVFLMRTQRRAALGLFGVMLAVVAIHADSDAFIYTVEGVKAVVSGAAPPVAADVPPSPLRDALSAAGVANPAAAMDNSASERLTAWRRGVEIGTSNWLAGIGYGMYAIADPVLTAPHSMMLLRFAESGVVGALGFVLLALYAPLAATGMLLRRDPDLFRFACLTAVSCFFVKAAVFGATFSVMGLVPWGFGIGLLLAASAPASR